MTNVTTQQNNENIENTIVRAERQDEIEMLSERICEMEKFVRQQENENRYAVERARRDGFEAAIECNKKEIKIGKKEIAKQLQKRRENKAEKLVWAGIFEDNGDLAGWARRAIKRIAGGGTHLDIDINAGRKKPEIVGEVGYYTTPSGKTVVHSPGAYSWATWYHCSTEEIVVGVQWIERNTHMLAMSEAEIKIK